MLTSLDRRFTLFKLLAAVTLISTSAAAADRPNLLWITSEDHSPYLGCYGDPQAQTPNLDRLAGQGVRFRNAFANAPVCSTVRTTLITGMHSATLGAHHHRSRVAIPAAFKLYPEHLRAAGYYATNSVKTDYNLAGNPKVWDESSARAHYRNRKPGQPFFAVFNFTTSHESQVAPKAGKTTFRIPPEKIVLPPYHPDTPELRRDWANYYDQMTQLDTQIGALLAELEREGLAEDTIVVFCSDHGGALPRGKRNIHDTGTRVPMIMRFPAKWQHLAPAAAGAWIDQTVSFVDLPVTFFSLLGVPIPGNYQGRPFLGEKKVAPRDFVYLYRGRMDERYDNVRAIRDREFRYVRNYAPHRPWGQQYTYPFDVMPGMGSWYAAFQAGRTNPAQSAYWQPKPSEELYRIEGDPYELKNLAGDTAHAPRLEAMRRTLRAEIIATRDTAFIPEGMFKRLAGTKTIYEYAQGADYPLERLIDLADRATSRDTKHLPELRKAMADAQPLVRYWGAVGCLVLQRSAQPAKAELQALLRDDCADIRTVAAEAVAYLGEVDAAVATITAVIKSGEQYEVLAAMNALEYLWRAGHVPLARVQEIVRGVKAGEPGDRVARVLLKAS